MNEMLTQSKGQVMHDPAKVEAVSMLDTAVDSLLTAYLHCGGLEVLTPDQRGAINKVLDLLDKDAVDALRYHVGLFVAREVVAP
jgi:hypothetical protein